MTFNTRFCPRMYREIPFTGKNYGSEKYHRCIDCAAILLWRRFRRALAEKAGR